MFALLIVIAMCVAFRYRSDLFWQRLATVYRSKHPISSVLSEKKNEWICLFSKYPNRYQGIVNLAVTEQGLLLQISPGFGLLHPFAPPLFIPHKDITITPTSFWINNYTTKLTLSRMPDVEILLDGDASKWYQETLGYDAHYRALEILKSAEKDYALMHESV